MLAGAHRWRSAGRAPGGEWVATFNSYSTDLPAGAAPLPAKLELAFPGRYQNRTVMQGVVTVPAGAAGQASSASARSYNLLLNGEVLQRRRAVRQLPLQVRLPRRRAAAPRPLPLVFQRSCGRATTR